jgi:hypothetical protein
MVSFRKVFLLMAILVAIATIASAQPATCIAYTSNAPNVRWEGLAEEVGQVVIECSGGVSAINGTALNTVNVQIFLNTNVTSRRTIANDNQSVEAVLLIDEPTPAQVTTASMCAVGASCPGIALGGGIYFDPTSATPNKNVFQGRLIANNSVVWTGVPFDAPGTSGKRYLRIANIRAHANNIALSTLLPSAVEMYITVSGTAAPNLQNNQLKVAYLQRGLRFGSSNNGATYLQCEPSDGAYQSTSVKKFELRFREWFATAFRDNTINSTGNQADLSVIYNTESMYYHPTVAGAWTGAGLATQATRLMATFTGIPANVIIRVPRTWTNGGDTVKYIQCFDGVGQNCSDALLGSGTSVEPTIVGGSVTVVYEVTTSSATTFADLRIPAELRWGPIKDGIAGPPGTGTVTVNGSYAPLSTTTTSILSPVPRFVTTDQSTVTFIINPCRTNLLFPYVTTQQGFDTGMVIANTSADKFGTVPQNGTCTLDYFGDVDGGAAPASVTTDSIPAGQSLVASVTYGGSGKNGYALPAAKGFQGYIIAKCNFQYAHGYAYVYKFAGTFFEGNSGYLALVLDGDKDSVKSGTIAIDPATGMGTVSFSAPTTRTGSISEVRGQ